MFLAMWCICDRLIIDWFSEYQYNTPVCIWLHENHPASWPRCWVRPSVSMVINPTCPFVDAQGLVTLPCLSNWTQVGEGGGGAPTWLPFMINNKVVCLVKYYYFSDEGSHTYRSNWTVCLSVCLSWTFSLPQGMSDLTRLIAEMRMAFQKVTPLYARIPPTVKDGDPVPLLGQQGSSLTSVLVHRFGLLLYFYAWT